MAKIYLDLTPLNNSFPKNYYEAKRLVSKLGLKSKKIDFCVKGCMLFYDNGKNDPSLLECKFYGQARYHTIHVKFNKFWHWDPIHPKWTQAYHYNLICILKSTGYHYKSGLKRTTRAVDSTHDNKPGWMYELYSKMTSFIMNLFSN